MDNDEVELVSDPGGTDVAAAIAVSKVVPVCHGTLMLHARVRNGDEFVAVLIPRIFAEPGFEGLEHSRNLLERLHRGFFLMRKYPKANVQRSAESPIFLGPIHV